MLVVLKKFKDTWGETPLISNQEFNGIQLEE